MIIEDGGRNELVETKRGKCVCNLDLTTEALDDINIDDYQKKITTFNNAIVFIRILTNLEETIIKTIITMIFPF